jgi:hypothetical protein
MVGLGLLMLLLGLWGAFARWRGELYQSQLFLRFAALMGPAGLIAILAGWMTTEIGRQPWVVYGLLQSHSSQRNRQTECPHGALLCLGQCDFRNARASETAVRVLSASPAIMTIFSEYSRALALSPNFSAALAAPT